MSELPSSHIDRGNLDGGPKDFDPTPFPRSVHVLYGNAIDYAGWAPPSANPLETAVENFRSYGDNRSTQWAMRNLALTYGHLGKLDGNRLEGLPLSVIVAAAGTAESDEQLHMLGDEDGVFADLNVRAVEMKVEDPSDIEKALGQVPEGVFPFFEIQLDPAFIGGVSEQPHRFGLKARTAGTEATSVEGLVAFLEMGGPKKITSGIHYPFTGVNPDSGRHDYGNVNVSVAAVAAFLRESPAAVARLLQEEDPSMFSFFNEGVDTNIVDGIPLEHIERARRESLQAIGTCNAMKILHGLEEVPCE